MQLTYQTSPRPCFVLLCGISEQMPDSPTLARIKAKESGFIWDKLVNGKWATDSARIALNFAAFADSETRERIKEMAQTEREPTLARMEYDAKRGRFLFYTPKVNYYEWNAIVKPHMRFSMLPEPHWWTEDADAATRLYMAAQQRPNFSAQPGLYEMLKEGARERNRALEASRATDAEIEIPCPDGLSYLPFQRAGVAYAMQRPNTLIGDQMRLGKTIQALGVINADPTVRKILVIVPATLKINWLRESEKWLVEKEFDGHTRKLIVGIGTNNYIPSSDVVIVNYEILGAKTVDGDKQLRRELRDTIWDVLIIDECHRMKSETALRSKFAFAIKARRKLYLSGTPQPNRPRELWPILHSLCPKVWNNKYQFLNRYCFAGMRFGHPNYDGAQHLDELQRLMRQHVLIRRLRAEVLTELPPKRRQVIELPSVGLEHILRRERERFDFVMREQSATLKRREELKVRLELAKASEDPEEYARAVEALKECKKECKVVFPFEEISKARYETAIAKLPQALEHIESLMEEPDKVAVFAHHKEVLQAVHKHFGDMSVLLYGDTPLQERQRNVDRFQSDPKCRLFIGGILAAGVGIDLPASTICFIEEDWVPGNVSQCEDRPLGVKTKIDSLLIQHLVLEGSIDAKMVRTVIRKQEVADRALDLMHEGSQDPELVERLTEDAETIELPAQLEYSDTTAQAPRRFAPEHRSATHGTTREQLEKKAAELKPEEIHLIHYGLRRLAQVCDGAESEDGHGFNSTDTNVGRELAGRDNLTPLASALGFYLLKKYNKSQLNGALDSLYK